MSQEPICPSLCFYLTRQLYQHLFHSPNFREALLEASGCPQLTSHLNSSVSSICCLQKGNQNPNSCFHQHMYHQMSLGDLVVYHYSVSRVTVLLGTVPEHHPPPPESGSSSSWAPKHLTCSSCLQWRTWEVSPCLEKSLDFIHLFSPLSYLIINCFSNNHFSLLFWSWTTTCSKL